MREKTWRELLEIGRNRMNNDTDRDFALLVLRDRVEAMDEVLVAARELNERSWNKIEQSRLSQAIAKADSYQDSRPSE